MAALGGLVCIGLAGWAVLRLIDWVELRRQPLLDARDLTTGRRRAALAAFLLAWTGAWLVGSWFLVHQPIRTRTDPVDRPDRPIQPAPPWLWQVGVGLVVLGTAGFLFASLTASPQELPSQARTPDPPLTETKIFVWLFAGMWIAAVTASAAASSSNLRAVPIGVAALFTVAVSIAREWQRH